MKRSSFQINSIVSAVVSVFLISIFVISCSEDKSREAATQEARQSATTESIAPSAVPFQQLIVGAMSVKAPKLQSAKGDQVCVPVTASGFLNIVSMQYTMAWDPSILRFSEIRSFGLPGLNSNNFGTNQSASGILTYSWYEPRVKGIDLKDGSVLYEVCFDVIGASGSQSAIRFIEDPVVFEITNPESNFLDLKAVDGTISVK